MEIMRLDRTSTRTPIPSAEVLVKRLRHATGTLVPAGATIEAFMAICEPALAFTLLG